MATQTKRMVIEPTAVQDFYEHYPYPRPVDSLDRYRDLWKDPERRRADYRLFWPAKVYREDHSILIAGCGTSQAAKHALRWPNARVVGIDFSATSVDCTATLKQEYGLDNLKLYQLPIEHAGELGTTFDQIVCTGVLHHLSDPVSGLKVLRSMLAPDGAMHLMVYAPYGRAGIHMLQEFCRRVGIAATDDGIRDLVATLDWLPAGHPLHALLRSAPDFQHEAALADALLHPQETSYSVPQLYELLRMSGMKFGRWFQQAPYAPRCGLMAQIPRSEYISQLSPEEQYAAAELFRGTMVTHSVVTYPDDAGPDSTALPASPDAWNDLVPVRIADTICVGDRLPEAAAGVLINRTHVFNDIYLPITEAERSMFDAIDGSRNIGALVARAKTAFSPDKARDFLERLWWYDQIVFDASLRA